MDADEERSLNGQSCGVGHSRTYLWVEFGVGCASDRVAEFEFLSVWDQGRYMTVQV